MRKMKRTLVDYKPGIKPNKDNIVRLDNDYCIYVTACGKHNEVFSGHVSMSDQEDWVQRYGLEHVSTGPQSYFNNIDDIADALTNVIDASTGEVIDDNIKEGDIFGLKYGCIVINKVITNKANKVASVALTPINGTHKWPKIVITLRTLRTVIDDIVKAYTILDLSVYRSTAHAGTLAMFDRMGLVKLGRDRYKKSVLPDSNKVTQEDPTLPEMYLAVLNGRISLLDREHMLSLSSICDGEIESQKIAMNGSVLVSSLKLISNY